MNSFHYIILILAYIGGLLLTGLWGFPNPHPSWQQWTLVVLLILIVPLSLFILLYHRWRRCPQLRFWFLVSLVAFGAVFYFQWRIPSPSSTDISYLIQDNFRSQNVQVLGKLSSEPRATNNNRKKFWLQAKKVSFNSPSEPFQTVTGKLYVTLPSKAVNLIYPGQILIIEGNLYKPRSPQNPGAFDFKKYLAKQGSFSGLKGEKIIFIGEKNFEIWTKLRHRIINGFTNALGNENGLVISSMILGKRAVDLPPEIRDLFVNIGLSHVLAASGFHVALLLGIVFWITQSLSPINKFIIGMVILMFYLGFTGIQPSILRATLMGIAILIGQILERKTNSLGALLLSGFLLLIFNPLWIWDLGFQLSFLATFALLVTSPFIENKLDFLPPKISSIIAVPVAVSIWTSPLIMYVFHTFSFYIIPFNILATPLIMFLVLGGIISAIFILISPNIGIEIAKILFWPLEIFLQSAQQIPQLKLSAFAVGQISLITLIIIYSILITIWLNKKWQKHWRIGALIIIFLIITPIIYKNLTLFKITILQGNQVPIIVMQNRGKVTLINIGNESDIKYTLSPFLSQQGINQIHTVILAKNQEKSTLSIIKNEIKINHIIYLFDNNKSYKNDKNAKEKITLNSTIIKALSQESVILQWQIKNKYWLWIDGKSQDPQSVSANVNHSLDILLWSGKKLSFNWVKLFKKYNPKVVIISTNYLPEFIKMELAKENIKWYWIQQDGAIQWIPKQGIQPLLNNQEEDS
ncbi:MAG: ComEC/Rec2 family competence protein [Crocosphaera sp.]|nr:ComEC/Rec2 family competence protein [Crocosphaera sp.]